MSTDVSASSSSVSPCLRGEDGPAPLGWLLAVLQAAIDGVMAGDVSPIQRASAVARLSHLYLKASRAAELQQTHKALARHVAELEQTLEAQMQQIAALEERFRATEGSVLDASAAAGSENGAATGLALLAGVGGAGCSEKLAVPGPRVPPTNGRSRQTSRPPPRALAGGRRR